MGNLVNFIPFYSEVTFSFSQASHSDYHCRQRSLATRLPSRRELLLEGRILHLTAVIPPEQWRYPCCCSRTGGEQRKIRTPDGVRSSHF